MAAIIQPYEVALTSNDLSPKEVMRDMLYNLERLDNLIDDVYKKVEKRVGDEQDRINQINTRVSSCKSMIDKVRGKQTATTIFSTAKFPAPKKLPAYPTLLSKVTVMDPPHRDAEDDTVYYPGMAKQSLVANPDAADESLLLLSRLNAHGSDLERVEFTMEDEGLGPFPPQIAHVGSVMLFNTSSNPYNQYQTLDNFMSTGRQKEGEEAVAKGLAAAPTSILSGDALPDIEGLDLNFKPQMGTMSSLSLPDNLPLDFVATNLNYKGAELPSIAPSAAMAGSALPQITNGYDSGPTAKEVGVYIPEVPASTGSSGGGGAAVPPPPPPPPPPGAPAPVAAAAPPPPPPPPTMATEAPAAPPAPVSEVSAGPVNPLDAIKGMSVNNLRTAPEEEAAPAPVASSGFVNPLDAIKGMSVNNLRKVAESDVQAMRKEKEEHEAAKPKSMMDEMAARMRRRNSAISGKDQKDATRKESTIIQQAQAAASMPSGNALPPPPGGGGKGERPKSSLMKVGFASLEDEGKPSNDDDSSDSSAPPMASRKVPFANDDFSSDDSSISDVSDVSFAPPPVPKTPSASAPAPAPAAAPSEDVPPLPAMPARRGSLLDGADPGMDKMLSASKAKVKEANSDSDDDDWD